MQTATQALSILDLPSLDHSGRNIGASPLSSALGKPVQSSDLLKGQKTVGILHNGSLYRLQATRLGKLILTK